MVGNHYLDLQVCSCIIPPPPQGLTQWLASNELDVAKWWNVSSEIGLHRDRDFCLALLSVLFCLFWWKLAAMLRDAVWRGTGGKELKEASGWHPRTWSPQCTNLQRTKSCQLPLEWGKTQPSPAVTAAQLPPWIQLLWEILSKRQPAKMGLNPWPTKTVP